MVEPEYFDIKKDMIKTVKGENYTVKVISGKFNGVSGVNRKYVKAGVIDFDLNPNSEIEIPIPEELNSFVYIFVGNGKFGRENTSVDNKTVALFTEGDEILAKAGDEGLRFILFAGKPLKENVAWGGPIVMNTDEELEEAFHELRSGEFIKH
jgi:redox-sensitive bicupin YhaK (pirin superfamily)